MIITEVQIEQAARSLAYNHWPLALEVERKRWEEKHWPEQVVKARDALTAALSDPPATAAGEAHVLQEGETL